MSECDIKRRLYYEICRTPSKRYARRTIGPCTTRNILDSRRSTPMLDGYAGSPVNQSVDSYSQQSASDGRQSFSSATCSPVSRQPVNNWTSYRTNSTASPPNLSDSIGKSANPALRSTLPADYKPSGYGSASHSNIRSNSSSSNSVNSDNRPRSTRSPAASEESSRADNRFSSSGDPTCGSMSRRHRRTYTSNGINGSAHRSSRHQEPRAASDQSSEWQVYMWISFFLLKFAYFIKNLYILHF